MLKFELEYDNAPHRTANNAEYELTLSQKMIVQGNLRAKIYLGHFRRVS